VSSGEDVVFRDDGTSAEEVASVFKADLMRDLVDGGHRSSNNLSAGEDVADVPVPVDGGRGGCKRFSSSLEVFASGLFFERGCRH